MSTSTMGMHRRMQGDTGYVITTTLRDGAGVGLDLTGTTVRIQIDRPGAVINAIATPDPNQALNPGAVSYRPTDADVVSPGVFPLRWEVTYASGATETSGPADVLVIGRQIA